MSIHSKIKILVADSSVIYRKHLRDVFYACDWIDSFEFASNRNIALQKLEQSSFDIFVSDIVFPDESNFESIKQLINHHDHNVKIILYSNSQHSDTLLSMNTSLPGVYGFVQKPMDSIDNPDLIKNSLEKELLPKIQQVLDLEPRDERYVDVIHSDEASDIAKWKKINITKFDPEVIVIGSSTGGPQALEDIFEGLGSPFCPPIFIVQHMPSLFTPIFAERLNKISNFTIKEGKHGEFSQRGHIYIAPGDFHMTLSGAPGILPSIVLDQGPKQCSVRPAVDALFFSAAKIYKEKLLGFILTGMGEDGRRGSCRIKDHNGGIFIQDKESSIVWGMPGSVFESSAYDMIGNLKECRFLIQRLSS